jgi:hypothetical protein
MLKNFEVEKPIDVFKMMQVTSSKSKDVESERGFLLRTKCIDNPKLNLRIINSPYLSQLSPHR